MRRKKISAWLCGALLCCAGPIAVGQSVSGSLAPNPVRSSSQPEDMTGASVNGSAVSADFSPVVDADVNADVAGQAGFGSGHGGAPGAGREAAASAVPRLGMRASFGRTARGDQIILAHRMATGKPGPLARNRHGAAQRPQRVTVQARTAGEATNRTGVGAQSGASYTSDFPDSTKGTALLSPFDPATASPLEWSPGLNFGMGDFTNRQFLSPSLHRGARTHRKAVAPSDKTRDALTSTDDVLQPPQEASDPTSILDQQ